MMDTRIVKGGISNSVTSGTSFVTTNPFSTINTNKIKVHL